MIHACSLLKVNNKIVIITGDQGSGKTSLLFRLVAGLDVCGLTPGGFAAEGFWNQNTRSHFELVDLITGKRILFCSIIKQLNWYKTGQFYINPEAVRFGEELLNPEGIMKSDFVSIDEIGPFEIGGNGWTKAIHKISDFLPAKSMIWIVRKSLLQTVIEYYNLQNFIILSTERGQTHDWIDKVAGFIDNPL